MYQISCAKRIVDIDFHGREHKMRSNTVEEDRDSVWGVEESYDRSLVPM